MTRDGFALTLGLVVVLCALPESGNAQGMFSVDVSAESAGIAYRSSRYEAALTVEILPLEAQVLLDGKPIGSGRDLVAVAVSVTPGWHTVEVGAPGYYPYSGRFVADQHSSANLFVVTLAPIR
jgi:hypothetical protein